MPSQPLGRPKRDLYELQPQVSLQDVLGNLRPQLVRHATFEEAFEDVAAIEAAEAAAEAAGVTADDSDSDEDDVRKLASDSEDSEGSLLPEESLLRFCSASHMFP